MCKMQVFRETFINMERYICCFTAGFQIFVEYFNVSQKEKKYEYQKLVWSTHIRPMLPFHSPWKQKIHIPVRGRLTHFIPLLSIYTFWKHQKRLSYALKQRF